MYHKKFTRLWPALLVFCLLAAAPAEEEPLVPGEFVVICPITGMIDEGAYILVQRALREAKDAAAIIFVVDTFGGRVDFAMDIADAILDSPARTIAYVDGKGAISAGALISYSCQDIVMAPGTVIGASAPVVMDPSSPQGTQATGEKTVSVVRAEFRSLANENGHNSDIAEAMVDRDIELRAWRGEDGKLIVRATDKGPYHGDADSADDGEAARNAVREILKEVDKHVPLPEGVLDSGEEPDESVAEGPIAIAIDEDPAGKVILPKGKLLTLDPREAIDYSVIAIIARDISEVMSYFDVGDKKRINIVATWSEDLFRWLTSPQVSGLLLMLGIGGLYFEVKTPGFGIPGIIACVCLSLFFGSRAVIGLADSLDLALVVLGVALILTEVFILPGFGISGVAGIISLVVGVYLSFTRVTIPQTDWDFIILAEMRTALLIFVAGFAAIVVLIGLLSKYFPQNPVKRALVLSATQDVADGYVVQTEEDEALLGMEGVSTSYLRPAGRARIGGKTLNVVSRGEFIEEGTAIIVVQVEGNRLVVDPVRDLPSL
jgi:membrane-bound serine protease (ClpP class)